MFKDAYLLSERTWCKLKGSMYSKEYWGMLVRYPVMYASPMYRGCLAGATGRMSKLRIPDANEIWWKWLAVAVFTDRSYSPWQGITFSFKGKLFPLRGNNIPSHREKFPFHREFIPSHRELIPSHRECVFPLRENRNFWSSFSKKHPRNSAAGSTIV